MLRFFERLVHPYPDAMPAFPPTRFFAFLWSATRGLRPYLLLMTLLNAVIGVFEAALFSMMGHIVDWMAGVTPSELWAKHGHSLWLLGGGVVFPLPVVTVLTLAAPQNIHHQSVAMPRAAGPAGASTDRSAAPARFGASSSPRNPNARPGLVRGTHLPARGPP